jgi:pimeloyl-ACP methyl ester carboxylesterase
VTARTTRFVDAGTARLCTEAFGAPADPPILLIMGQMASMLWWPTGFCEQLAGAGRHVIRYDHRDTGLSSGDEPGHPTYSSADLVRDAVAVLDGHGLDRAHVVGLSMGGALAQVVALTAPERVASLTAISTTAATGQAADLPGPTPAYLEHMRDGADVDWTDVDAIAGAIARDAVALAGTRHPVDAAAIRAAVDADLARAARPQSLINHTLLEHGEEPDRPLTTLDVPTLVIHGDADPLFPIAHGTALAAMIPGATLVTIAGGGHELHRGDWPQVVAAITAHTA